MSKCPLVVVHLIQPSFPSRKGTKYIKVLQKDTDFDSFKQRLSRNTCLLLERSRRKPKIVEQFALLLSWFLAPFTIRSFRFSLFDKVNFLILCKEPSNGSDSSMICSVRTSAAFYLTWRRSAIFPTSNYLSTSSWMDPQIGVTDRSTACF